MKKTLTVFLLLAAILLLPSSIGALDFGLLLDQYAAFGGYADDGNLFEYRAGLIPRVNWYFGDKAGFFLSGSVTGGYRIEFYFVPELLRTEFSYYSGSLGVKAGRFHYSDPLAIVADSLFDGVQLTYGSHTGRFSLGAWYTGFLYKKNARITMTEKEQENYDAPIEYGDFFNTYFAANRLLASVEWEHLSLFDFIQAKAAVLGQIDLTGDNNKINSQYFILSASIPYKSFLFRAGGSFEAVQFKNINAKNYFAFAGELGVYWTLPTSFYSILSLSGHYASGQNFKNNNFGAFKPVTTKFFGDMLQTKMTSILFFDLNYSMRINESLGTSITAAYYRRSDLITDNVYIKNGSGNYNFGGEIFAHFVWSPFSDLNLNFGIGAFFPFLGDVWQGQYGKIRWRVDLGAILALY